jgi:Double zinc ribbon
MYCEQCQSEYPEDRKFCPRCGILLKAQLSAVQDTLMECSGCGKANEPTRKFCIYCGARLRFEHRLCPACGVPAPIEAAFCGECGALLSGLGTKTLELPEKSSGEGMTSREHPTVSLPFPNRGKRNSVLLHDREEETKGDTEEKGPMWRSWFQLPMVRVVLSITFLGLFGFFSYHLGRVPQAPDGRLSESPPQTQTSSAPSPAAVSTKEESPRPIPSETVNPEKPKPGDSSLQEEPLSPPRFYNVVKATAVRDKPSLIGKEVAQLEPETSIYVVAQAGDWLKVESKSTPPKPPGYVWKEDAVPE